MPLYHASRREYECGQTVTMTGFNDFSTAIRAEGKDWVEEILESCRPPGHIPRREALYAFDSIDACSRFAEGEERKRSTGRLWRFYEVEMIEPSRHPIYLVDLIWKLDLEEGDELAVVEVRIPQPWNDNSPACPSHSRFQQRPGSGYCRP
jgi:hypothetical protein